MNAQHTELSLEQTLRHHADVNAQLHASANKDLERNLVLKETAEFRDSITDDHKLFAVTLTPDKETLIRYRLTRNKQECVAYIQSLVTDLLHLIHKNCHNNYARYESKLTRFFAPVEFTDKHHKNSVTPHTHAVFAVHKDYLETFESLLIQHSFPDTESEFSPEQQMTIDFNKFKTKMKSHFLDSKIASIHITELKKKDLFKYSCYCFKEQIHALQIATRDTRL